MKIQNKNCRRTNWLKKPILAEFYQDWLVDDGSLTARLQKKYQNFSVKKVRLQYAKPLSEEVALLQHKRNQRALIREVLLIGDNQSVVFAHSVLPRTALRGTWNKLGLLGNKPLGATLFANPKVKRMPLEFKKLSQHHPLYLCTTKHIEQKPAFLWARRSAFSLNCANILVTEIFLPQILIK